MKNNIFIEKDKVVEVFNNGIIKEHISIHLPINTNTHVICNHCGKIYDLTRGKVFHRFSDCDVFTTECCNTQVDTREWVDLPAFTRLTKIFK